MRDIEILIIMEHSSGQLGFPTLEHAISSDENEFEDFREKYTKLIKQNKINAKMYSIRLEIKE